MTDPTLSAVIADFVASAGTAGERRERRAALSHVDAALGTMRLRAVRPRNVAALLDDLHDAGLSARRETAVVDALRSLYAFAMARGLVAGDPTPGAPVATSAPAPAGSPTPTLTMLALGARVAVWTAWTITIVFAVLLVALVLELG